MAGDVRERLLTALEAEAPAHGYDIVDVEVVGVGGQSVVCVRLDYAEPGEDPVSLDDVAAQSDWVNRVVEDVDPFSGSYTLEVSSPGLDRPLRREKDFLRFAGQTVSITTTAVEGRRKYTGELLGVEDGNVAVSCDDERFSIPMDQIKSAKIKPVIDFSSKTKGKKNRKDR